MAQIGCFRSRRFGPYRSCGQGIHPRGRIRQHFAGRIHLHGRDERSRIHSQQHERARSLILFDELGRGTSTYDGISIAWSIVEYIHEHGCSHPKTLFATHYHELNEMETTFPVWSNYNVSVKEIDGKVVFLRKLARGGSEHSFGIHVAKLAGMPKEIVNRAGQVLKQLETNLRGDRKINENVGSAPSTDGMQLSFFQLDDPVLTQVRDLIINLDIDRLTPIDALNKLHDIRQVITGK